MNLLMTKSFNGVALDCYKADNEQDGFWATREQIGRLLEYKNPANAIKDIHNRNLDRLNKFSTQRNLRQVEGDRTVTREITFYNFKGFLEICRYSNQPKANDVMDFAWNIMDEIRRTGSYGTKEPRALDIRAAELLKDIAQYTSGYEQKEIIKEAFKLATGHEMPQAPKSQRFWTAEQIGKTLKWPFDAVMYRAENLGITKKARNGYWDDETWYFSKEDRKKFLNLVEEKIIKIEDGVATYEDGHKRLHWDFDPDDYRG